MSDAGVWEGWQVIRVVDHLKNLLWWEVRFKAPDGPTHAFADFHDGEWLALSKADKARAVSRMKRGK